MSQLDDMETEPCAPSPADLFDLTDTPTPELLDDLVIADLVTDWPAGFFEPVPGGLPF
jgi:hypothetical protein